MLGKRPRKATLRYVIWRILNECGERTSEELGLLLKIDPANLAKRHLSPLVEEGALERTIPDRPRHPEQAYRSTSWPPGADRGRPGGE
jgi:predicted ArsR family transcriptional regulator